jgi:L-lactate dehydrogenase complex protein LldG
MKSRDTIYADIRGGLGVLPARESARRAAAERRLKKHPRHLVPQLGQAPKDALPGRFASALEAHGATVIEIVERGELPRAVSGYLAEHGLAPRLASGAEPLFAALAWSSAGIEHTTWDALPTFEASLSRALAGVAETGTLLLASGAENPTSLAFLPETHIVAVARSDIVGCYEDAFEIVRAAYEVRPLPRSLNLVTGPSRTGDIGGRIVTGAHGPRRLAVIIFNGSEGRMED